MQNHIGFIRSPKKEVLGILEGSDIYACPSLVLALHLIDSIGDRISSEMDLDVISCEYSYILKETCHTSVNLF